MLINTGLCPSFATMIISPFSLWSHNSVNDRVHGVILHHFLKGRKFSELFVSHILHHKYEHTNGFRVYEANISP